MGGRSRRQQAQRERRPRLADLIDFELQLQRDRAAAPEALQARDAALAAELAGRGLTGRSLLLAWLDALRERSRSGMAGSAAAAGAGPFVGERTEALRGAVAALLVWAGLFVGAATTAGWLLGTGGAPVNVIRFWLGEIGVQLPLLLLALGALPAAALRAVPGRALWSWLPAAAAALLLRLPGGERGLARELAALRRLDWLYGRLRGWILCGLTQGFAIGFNTGALAAFVLISYVDDPAFGWRSRLFDADDVQRAVQGVSLPWRGWLPAAVPSLEVIRATRYSSLDPRYAGAPSAAAAGADDVWAAWWPFLLASLLVYGLLPRLLLWTAAHWAAARAVARAPLAHADALRLRERLERPLGLQAQPTAAGALRGAAPAAPEPSAETGDLAGRPLQVLCWAGVSLGEGPLRARLAASTGACVAPEVLRVGAIERSADERALEALRGLGSGGAAALCVEAWEPPVADYTDFLRAARAALGGALPLVVWLVESDDAIPAPAREAHLSLWRRQLAALGDPWLRVTGWPAAAAP